MCTPLRKCRECGKEANTEDELLLFRSRKTHKYNRENLCKQCDSKKANAYLNSNKHLKERRQNTYYYKTYGLTLEEYKLMYKKQDGRCFICKNKEGHTKLSKLVVDHYHTNGTVRSLLCGKCNTALGIVEENITTLNSMINYIKDNR